MSSKIVNHFIVHDEIEHCEDFHIIANMDLHSYVIFEIIKCVLVIINMVDMDFHIAANVDMVFDSHVSRHSFVNFMDVYIEVELNLHVANVDSLVTYVVEDLHDTVHIYVPDLPTVDLAKHLHVSLYCVFKLTHC